MLAVLIPTATEKRRIASTGIRFLLKIQLFDRMDSAVVVFAIPGL